MDLDDFPLSEEDRQQIDETLTKLDIYVIEQKQLVSYQWLSNELGIDAVIARQALSAFIEQHRDELDVLWLLSGRTTAVNKHGLSQPQEQQQQESSESSASSGGSNSSSYINIDEDDTGDVVKVHEITLVRDADLDAVKQQFESIVSLHPYSVSPKPTAQSQPIKDLTGALYTLQMQQLLAMYDQPGEEVNALRDGRYSAIKPDPLINRSSVAGSLSSVGIIDHPNGHSRDNQPSVPALTSAAAPLSTAAAGSGSGEMAGLKKPAVKSNALANMFSKQTAALKQTPLPASARADNKAVDEPTAVQSNAATVLPAEEQKEERTDKHSKVEADEDEDETMEDAEATVEEDEQPASTASTSKHKPSSASRKGKAKKSKSKSSTSSSTKKKRKRQSHDDEFVYPNPYDSHSDEEKEVAEAEEEEEERYRAAAVEDVNGTADEHVPDSIGREEREDERMDGTEAGSKFKQFFTSQPSTQSTSAAVPKQRRKIQKTFLDTEGYMRVEEVEEDDEEADRQREDREREEEKAREEKEGKRKEQRDKERKEKEKAEEEEKQKKEKEKKEKREQKKQEKKELADKAKEEETASLTGKRGKRKTGTTSDDEVMEEEEKEKKEKAGKKGKKRGKEDAQESGKEKAAPSKNESDKAGKKEKGGKAAADNKPKNNASILSFFNRK